MTQLKNNSGAKVIHGIKLTCVVFVLELQLKMNSLTKQLVFEPKC